MSSSRRYSTCTVRDDGRIVPWLAASGPLSYTPENPPTSDYYFQYGWILPGIFAPATNRRRRFYFGEPVKQYANELFAFWKTARERGAPPDRVPSRRRRRHEDHSPTSTTFPHGEV